MKKVYLFVCFFCCLISSSAYGALGRTIREKGKFISLSSFQTLIAEIDGKTEHVCLPTLFFEGEVDKDAIQKALKEGIPSQDAVFNLYHDGLGRPKRKNGMLYASEVFFKELENTYTSYLKTQGYKFKVSSKPAFEESSFGDVLAERRKKSSSPSVTNKSTSPEDIKQAKRKAELKKLAKRFEYPPIPPRHYIKLMSQVLPPGVVHPSTRKETARMKAAIEKNRGKPFETEDGVEVDPVRWAKGVFGKLHEDGRITGSVVEGKRPNLVIRVPAEKNWLTDEMVKNLQGKPCEFMIQRYINGRESFENGAFVIRDIFLYSEKLDWNEWLSKYGKKCPEFSKDEKYASQPTLLTSVYIRGTWLKYVSPAVCLIGFKDVDGMKEKEYIRLVPPKKEKRPANFKSFMNSFDKTHRGKVVGIQLLTFQDGRPYTELGQKRATFINFIDENRTLRSFFE